MPGFAELMRVGAVPAGGTGFGMLRGLSNVSEPVMPTIDRELDARGLNCPLPILRAKKTLNDMATGQLLRIVATDPGSVRDFQAFAKQTGNELIEHSSAGSEFMFLLKKR